MPNTKYSEAFISCGYQVQANWEFMVQKICSPTKLESVSRTCWPRFFLMKTEMFGDAGLNSSGQLGYPRRQTIYSKGSCYYS